MGKMTSISFGFDDNSPWLQHVTFRFLHLFCVDDINMNFFCGSALSFVLYLKDIVIYGLL